jgi:hypothetical protein
MPQPPNPKTGQGHPGQSDPENRAVTHTKPRRFSLNSRRIDRCPLNYYWSIPLTPFRNHTRDRGASVGRDLADAAQQGPSVGILRPSSSSCAATASKSTHSRVRETLRGCRLVCRSGREDGETD